MKTLAIAFLAAAIVTPACAADPMIERAQTEIRARLKDPDPVFGPARIGNLAPADKPAYPVVCFTVRARNGFGGYNVETVSYDVKGDVVSFGYLAASCS